MIILKLTSFNGNVKRIQFNTASLANNYIKTLPNALPKTTTLQVSCDALGISGHIQGVK